MKLTESQNQALTSCIKFIEHGDSNEWFMLEGKAGVGKTTVLIELMIHFYKKHNIVTCAIAHKAKSILHDKFKARLFSKKNNSSTLVNFTSVASLIGMKFDESTGEFIQHKDDFLIRPIDKADIIIVDEASMIDDYTLSIIMKEKKFKTKVIFSGDMGQLPPIRKDSQSDECSPVFMTSNKFKLFERLRQGEESPILPYSDYYWNSIIDNVDYVSNSPRHSLFSDKGNLHFIDANIALNQCIPIFKKSIDTNDTNLLKCVCFRNEARSYINNYVRNNIYLNDVCEYNIGDIVMMQNNYEIHDMLIENSLEFQVIATKLKIEKILDEDIKVWYLTVDYKLYDNYVTLPVVSLESMQDFKRLVQYLFDVANSKQNAREKKDAFKFAYRLKNRFAELDYSYAITSHKSQGSTYKAVCVYESDIMSVSLSSYKTKLRSMYTSITRASNMCIIMNDYLN